VGETLMRSGNPIQTVRDLMERLIEEGSSWRPRDYDSWVRLSFVEPRTQAVAP